MKKFNVVITTKCDKNCSYCFSEKTNREYSLLELEALVNHPEITHINILGGEPLIHSEIESILFYLNQSNINYSLMTNFKKDLSTLNINTNIIPFGISIGHIDNDDDYEEFRKNLYRINLKYTGIQYVLTKDIEKIEKHKKYLKLFFDEFRPKLSNTFNICVTLEHPSESFQLNENSFHEHLSNSHEFINDLKNIINLKNIYYPEAPINLGCGGIYRCMFQNQQEIDFINNNVVYFKHGCPKDQGYPFFVQGDECYICPPAKKMWVAKVKPNLEDNYADGFEVKKQYKNVGAPVRCQACQYYNVDCHGPCLGYYNKIV